MTLKTNSFIYTMSGKQAPYKVMKFDLNGVLVGQVGEIPKASLKDLTEFAEKHELFLTETKSRMSVAASGKKVRKRVKK